MGLDYKNYVKCQGCLALSSDEELGFSCKLGYIIWADKVNDHYISPSPTTKCYKPTNEQDYIESFEKLKKGHEES